MLALVVFLSCLLIVCGIGVLASFSDLRGLIIPNSHSIIVIVAFAICFLALYVFGVEGVLPSLVSSLMAAGIFFGVTFAMFALKMLVQIGECVCALGWSWGIGAVFVLYDAGGRCVGSDVAFIAKMEAF